MQRGLKNRENGQSHRNLNNPLNRVDECGPFRKSGRLESRIRSTMSGFETTTSVTYIDDPVHKWIRKCSSLKNDADILGVVCKFAGAM